MIKSLIHHSLFKSSRSLMVASLLPFFDSRMLTIISSSTLGNMSCNSLTSDCVKRGGVGKAELLITGTNRTCCCCEIV
ncbi:hypothetical protein T02_7640 [Trichinella nativa]|uniref:Uncharacterized protein n=1 Tax=Trichinella nativa TaxID=6335 RepID=A0A0V1L4K0_9BILA|nr:hypothetical protein T02_7640 [Trichinella nativa]